MKKILIYLSFIFLLTTLVGGCRKDDPPDDNEVVPKKLVVLREINAGMDVTEALGSAPFIRQTDGSCVFAYTSLTDNQTHLIKYTADGILQWNYTFGSYGYEVCCLDALSSGNYLLGLYSQALDMMEIRAVDPSGDSLWRFSRAQANHVYDACELPDGKICLATVQDKRAFLIMLDASGDSLASIFISDTMPRFAEGFQIISTPDGKLISAFNFNDEGPNHFVYLTKSDTSGNEEWQQLMSSAHMTDMTLLSDGGLLCVVNGEATRILRIDAGGHITADYASALGGSPGTAVLMPDGGYFYGTIGMVSIFDAAGTETWSSMIYPDVFQSYIACHKIVSHGDGTYSIFGYRDVMPGLNPLILQCRIE